MSNTPSIEVSNQVDAEALVKKMQLAESAFDRARESLEKGDLNLESRRYLNQLFTSMIATEDVMCW